MVIATRRFLDGLFALSVVRIAIWIWIITFLWPGLFSDPNAVLPSMDAHHYAALETADWMTIVKWGQLPLWNPWACGGLPGSALPDSGVFAPDFVLRLVYGVDNGRRLAVLLFAVLGMEGTYRVVRRVDGSAIAGFATAVLLVFNDRIVGFLSLGWIHYGAFFLTPWIVLAVIGGRTQVAWRVIGGLALGWIALDAGAYSAPAVMIGVLYLMVTLGISALLARPRARWHTAFATVKCVGTILSLGILVAMVKLAPMSKLFGLFNHVAGSSEGDLGHAGASETLLRALLALLAMIAILTGDRWARIFGGGAILFLALAMGQYAEWEPSSFLRGLPLVAELRTPERFTMLFFFFAALATARGITRIEDGISAFARAIGRVALRLVNRRRSSPFVIRDRAGWALVASVFGSAAMGYGMLHLLETSLEPVALRAHTLFMMPGPREMDQDFKQSRGNRRDAHVFPPMNRGSLYCYLATKVPESSRLRADLAAEEYAEDPAAAKVTRKAWSPNEVTLDVDASAPARVLVNQNWNRHWTSDVGAVANAGGLLAVDVPAGEHAITLRYRDRGILFCFLLSFLTMFGSIAFLAHGAGKRAMKAVRTWREMGVFSPFREDKPDAEESKKEDKS